MRWIIIPRSSDLYAGLNVCHKLTFDSFTPIWIVSWNCTWNSHDYDNNSSRSSSETIILHRTFHENCTWNCGTSIDDDNNSSRSSSETIISELDWACAEFGFLLPCICIISFCISILSIVIWQGWMKFIKMKLNQIKMTFSII